MSTKKGSKIPNEDLEVINQRFKRALELAKAKLAAVINKIIEEKDFTEAETAKILGLNQPKISALKNGRLKGFSIESLFFFLEALDQHIEITITHKSKTSIEPRINVAYV